MELVTSQIREEIVSFGIESGQLEIYDGLITPISEDVVILSDEHKTAVEAFTLAALKAYGPKDTRPEPTLVQQEFGIPALVTRVDCTLQGGVIAPYELEDSPSGLGITDKLTRRVNGIGIQERVLEHYQQNVGGIPFVIISGSRNHGTDDPLIYGEDKYHFTAHDHRLPAGLNGDAVIVKTIPGMPESQTPYAQLSSRALAPLHSEGDKTYAERIGLVKEVKEEADLLRQTTGELDSQVLKARLGSMALGISVYLEPSDRIRHGKKGTVTATRLLNDLSRYVDRDEAAYVQGFVPPIRIDNPQNRSNMILRIFVLTQISPIMEVSTEVIGGCYVARPELIVHGAANSVAGPILVH